MSIENCPGCPIHVKNICKKYTDKEGESICSNPEHTKMSITEVLAAVEEYAVELLKDKKE